MMRNLLFISILLPLFISCTPGITKGFHATNKKEVVDEDFHMLYIEDGIQKYNMTFDFRKNHFSGLLLIKRTGADTYRLVFNSHFGMSLFDVELTKETIHIHHCIEPLQKKQLFKLVYRDFTTLLGVNPEKGPATIYTNSEYPDLYIYKNKKGYFRYNNRTKGTEQILTGKRLGKTLFCYDHKTEDQAGLFKIIHCRIGIILTLQMIK